MKPFRFSSFLPFLDFSTKSPFVHRDLSWLQFNERVLSEALKSSHLLLERVKFLAISASNLDEFFSIRVSSLEKSLVKTRRSFEIQKNRELVETRDQLFRGIKRLGELQRDTLKILSDELSEQGISLHLDLQRKRPAFFQAKEIFENQIAPHLPTPERFHLKSLSSLESLQSAVILPGGFWIKIPKTLPLLFSKTSLRPQKWDFFFQDLLLLHFLNPPLEGRWNAGILRITRDGDYEYDLADADTKMVPELIQGKVENRERGRPIRLQFLGKLPQAFLDEAAKTLGLDNGYLFPAPDTLNLQSLWGLYRAIPQNFGKKQLRINFTKAPIPPLFKKTDSLFERIKERDLLLHHPYDSFDAFVKFMEQASQDPNVVSIEQTIYRMDPSSPLLDYLKTAAKTKKVKVAIELRARFDELNNLKIASVLKKAGVKVVYGFGKLKLHAKVVLITRKENGTLRHYTHLSTGNYHSGTAQSYTDLAILTANEEMGADARYFFDSIYEKKIPSSFKKWVVAPDRLSKKVHSLINQEIAAAKDGKKTRIFVKVNALVDKDTIESLYKASQAGVKIDLVVRGACSLIPGIKGISDNIRVLSIIDYFLEHSRIYYFESSNQLYLSSADWMPRNFLRRLEIAFPVLDPKLSNFFSEVVLPSYLKDTAQAKELTPQGTWKKRSLPKGDSPFRSQFFFRELAESKYRGTELE